jgi:hypothetical protein
MFQRLEKKCSGIDTACFPREKTFNNEREI